MTRQLVDSLARARAYVDKIPGAVSGAGGHDQTFTVARALVTGFCLSEGDAMRLLLEYNTRCSPPWSEQELRHKLESASSTPSNKPRGWLLGDRRLLPAVRPPVARPAQRIDPATAVENFLKGFRADECEVWEASPIRPPDDWQTDAAALVSALYRPGEQINVVTEYLEKDGKARPVGDGLTIERDEFLRRFSRAAPASKAGAWLRMNPTDGRGIGDVNVTVFRFALLECDNVPLDLQLSLFARLPLPLACILTSGGKSLHAWVKVDAPDVNEYRRIVARMLALLARFGVDGKNKNPSRLSRLPGVQRTIGMEGDGRQRLLYLDPDPIQRKIL